jgi:hypothetical protein
MARSTNRFPLAPAIITLVVCTALGLGIGSALGSRRVGQSELVLNPVDTTIAVVETTAPPLEVPTTVVDTSLVEDTVPDTTIAEPPETTEAPPPPETTEPPRPPDLALSRGGAFLQPPGNAARYLLAPDDECNSLSTSGAAIGCGRLVSRGVPAYWVHDSDGTVRVVIRDPSAEDDTWTAALETADDGLSDTPAVADVSGDGEADLIVGWRDGDNIAIDVVELVDGQPTVTLHLDLSPGSKVRVSGGELLVWRSVGDGQLAQYSVTGGSGAWRVSASDFVPADSIGPSQF